MGKRERLDLLLLERGLVDSRENGRRKILAGEVLVNDQAVTKAGSLVDAGAAIRLKPAPRYVSRGGTLSPTPAGEAGTEAGIATFRLGAR